MRYEQIKPILDEEVLDEVKMSPSALQKFARSPEAEGMLMGIEFEMCVPNVSVDDDSGEGEYDYDMDERAYSIDDIVEFFQNGEMAQLTRNGAERLRQEMWDQYLDWTGEKIQEDLDQSELESRVRNQLLDDMDVNDYMDAAAEELGIDPTEDDESEAKVRERAEELLDDAVEEMMGDSPEYEYAYDNIRQEMEDEMRDSADYDQEAWLRDIGIDYMSEAEREWNLDWPHWTSYGGEGELDVETVGDEFGRAMGLDFVNTSSSYHGARRDGKNWIIEPDSSIDADSGDGGLEFVSPPMPIKDGLEMIQKMYAWAKKEGCYTNKSTGLHMNISVPDMTIDKLDYVKLALFLGDEYVLKQFGREYNSYCKSAMSKIKDRVRPEEVSVVLATMKQHLNSLASKTIHSGITDKYTSINTKDKYVEFRGPGGDYLNKDPFEIINTALRLSMSLRIATDPEAYKKEYAKKLYKLIEQGGDPDEAVQLFSKYAVGELPKEDLIARIKFARKEREIKKGKTSSVSRAIDSPAIKDEIRKLPSYYRELAGDIKDWDEDRIKNILRRIETDDWGDGLTPDQKNLFTTILNNELEYRAAQGEKKQYWVMNKDGTGGKQMVFADNENEAILKGGKQMGMSREESITKLRASEKVEEPASTAQGSGSGRTKYSRDVQIIIASMPSPFASFTENIPIKTDETLATAVRRAADGEFDDSLNRKQLQTLIQLINDEQSYRAAYGEGPAASGTELEFQTGEPATTEPSLPTNWDQWIRSIGALETSTLNNVARMVRQGGNEVINSLTASDREYLLSRISQEIERRATGGSNAGTTEWPRPWNQWVANIQDQGLANINNVRATMSDPAYTGTVLSNEQKRELVQLIDVELRRRMEAGETGEEPAQQELNFDQDPAAAQQQQLRRDDPVTSNDPEAESPIANQGTEDFRIYNPYTNSVVSIVRQGTLDYAIQKARQHEQDLGLEAGTLQVSRVEQTNESINILKRLAGVR